MVNVCRYNFYPQNAQKILYPGVLLPLILNRNQGDGTMKDLINFIAQALVDHPEQVSVTEVGGHQTSVLELQVAKEDIGKVIGKQGRTIKAMRTILNAASAKGKKRTVLEIVE